MTDNSAKENILIQMEGIEKFFPGVHALNNCRFELRKGEVHALVGENGAGKSTLMKVLTGIYPKDRGVIRYKGREVDFQRPIDAQKTGIGMIHQELNLMPHLTVAENILIGREPMNGIFIKQHTLNSMAGELLKSLHIDIDPQARIKDLTVAKQQMVEIAKAISLNSEVLIMDEPTAALTDNEITDLFRFIRDLRAEGRGIIYISHRLEELEQIADRVSVMRDGQYIGTLSGKDASIDRVIKMMVGRVIYEEPKTKSTAAPGAPVVLEVRNLTSLSVKDVSFQLKQGEILGFAGLMGAGRTETVKLIFGADKKTGGEIFLNGKKADINSPSDAVGSGIGYLSEDRKRYGILTGLNVADNAVLPSLKNYTGYLFVDDKRIDSVTTEYVKKIDIKTPSNRQVLKNLSGGNQQKLVIAKWLIKNCSILIFDEPTRGIDVGAKSEIYKLMNQLVASGKSIIMISSELPELLRMSDRIIVMCEGVKTGELDISEATQEKLMYLATQNRKEVV